MTHHSPWPARRPQRTSDLRKRVLRKPALRTLSTAASLTGLALLAAACSTGSAGSAGSLGAAGDGKAVVVTSFYPIEFATQRIVGDTKQVSVLTRPGTEPHDFELAPQDLTAMTRSRLLIYSKGFQPAVDEGVAQVDASKVLDVSGPADLTLTASDDGHDHADGEGRHDGSVDPHFWLDPQRYAAVATAIGDRLAADDPANAATYRANTAAFVADLQQLDSELRTGLRSCAVTELVTSHAAFGYLAQRYGFHQHGISGISPEAEPSAAALKAISDLIKTDGVTTIYQETLVEPHFAQTVAGSTGAKLATLDPVEGITAESPGKDYFEVMRANLRTLEAGQGCR